MWLGEPSGKGVKVVLPSPLAAEQLTQLRHSVPKDAAKYALKLLSIFFSDSELAESNCTPAEGRKLLNKDVLKGIQCEYMYDTVLSHAHVILLSYLPV